VKSIKAPVVSIKDLRITTVSSLPCMIDECNAEVRIWMISHRLLTNDKKTEFLIIGSYQQLSKVSIESIAVGTSVMKPVECVRNLGAWSPKLISRCA
ncbi:unnamed protein product, partial [Porites lobata]